MAVPGESLLWFFHVDGFFSKEPFYTSEMTCSFSGPWVETRGGIPNQDEIQGVPVSFSTFPWTQSGPGSSPLVSDHCLHCTLVHSCFHDPKQQLLFPFLRESILWSDILRNLTFIHLPYFPLLSHLSVPFPVAQPLCHEFIIEGRSWAPLRKAEFFWVSPGVIWNALSAFLHSCSQFRNVLVLCLQVCHTCQLHVAVWNILKHLKHCWIPTCDGFTRLWSSFEQRHHLTTDTLGESLQQELNPVWNVLSSTLWRGGELFPALAWILCEILGKSFKSWCFICQMGHYRALPARAGCGWADVTARTPGFFPEGIWGVISCAVSLKTWLLDGADGLCVTDGFLGQRIPVWASLTRCGQVMGSVWDTELQPQGISPTGDDLLLAGECLQRCDCAWWGYSTPKTQNRVGRMGVGFFWSDFSVYPSSSLW